MDKTYVFFGPSRFVGMIHMKGHVLHKISKLVFSDTPIWNFKRDHVSRGPK